MWIVLNQQKEPHYLELQDEIPAGVFYNIYTDIDEHSIGYHLVNGIQN